MSTYEKIDNGPIWINTAWKKRNYECTNVVAARGDRPAGEQWREGTEADIPRGATSLHISGNTRFLGYL